MYKNYQTKNLESAEKPVRTKKRTNPAPKAPTFYQDPYFVKFPLICTPAYMYYSQRSREISVYMYVHISGNLLYR